MRKRLTALMFTAWIASAGTTSAGLFGDAVFDVAVDSDVIYGTGIVHTRTTPTSRDLLLDVYRPLGGSVPGVLPGFIMMHGGAWMYGSKDDIHGLEVDGVPGTDTFDNTANPGAGDTSSPTKEYAMAMAARGYVVFSIEYRLGPDFPMGTGFFSSRGIDATWAGGVIGDFSEAVLGPVERLSVAEGIATLEAAMDDLHKAIDWVVENASTYHVSPNHIAVGGYSAGALTTALEAYLAGNEHIAAVWQNSGGLVVGLPEDITGGPPATLFHGTLDSVVPIGFAVTLDDRLDSLGIESNLYAMEGDEHFYRLDRTIATPATKGLPATLEHVLADDLYEHLELDGLAATPAEELPVAPYPVLILLFVAVTTGGTLALRERNNKRNAVL